MSRLACSYAFTTGGRGACIPLLVLVKCGPLSGARLQVSSSCPGKAQGVIKYSHTVKRLIQARFLHSKVSDNTSILLPLTIRRVTRPASSFSGTNVDPAVRGRGQGRYIHDGPRPKGSMRPSPANLVPALTLK